MTDSQGSASHGRNTDLQNPGPLICFSHLRWDFVFQRPQHLMSRFARERRVYVFEEPILCDHHRPYLEYHPFAEQNVIALRPRLPHWWNETEREAGLRTMLDMLIDGLSGAKPILWFYTPLMFGFAAHVEAAAVVYDCMDELSAFHFAPPELHAREAALLLRADIVFTGGHSLFEAKRAAHDNIHAFPSSVDVGHFRESRVPLGIEPADQIGIPHPRFGYYGVIDERMDVELLEQIAIARPDWQIVLIGPVVKIDPARLPHRPNLHYLGGKNYDELPGYLAGWDVALIPFLINDTTQFISPTKTPEYLAAGRPVVSTPIADVVRGYGGLSGVAIAERSDLFITACETMLTLSQTPAAWRPEADAALAKQSWDDTFRHMDALLDEAVYDRIPHIFRPASATKSTPSRPAVRVSKREPSGLDKPSATAVA